MLGFKKLSPAGFGGEAAECWTTRSSWSPERRAESVAPSRSGARGPGPTSHITYRRNQTGADATAAEIRSLGRRVEVIRTDISRREDIDALVKRLKQAFDRVDVWINNAGADILTGEGGRLDRLEKLDLVLARGSSRDGSRLLGGGRSDAGAGRRSHHQHGLGPCHAGHEGREPRALLGSEGRDRQLQQIARPRRRSRYSSEHSGPRLHRDRLRRGGRPEVPPEKSSS